LHAFLHAGVYLKHSPPPDFENTFLSDISFCKQLKSEDLSFSDTHALEVNA